MEQPATAGRSRGMLANAGALFVSRIIVAIFGWAGTIFIVRTLSPREWGQYTFVFSLLTLVAVLSNVVNNRVAIHGLLKDDADRFAGSYVLLRGLFGLLAYCVALAFVVLADYPSIVVQATAIGGVVILVATPSNAYDAIFQARMQMGWIGAAWIVGQVVQFVLTVVLALLDSSLILFTIPVVLAEIVIISVKVWRVRALQRIRYVRDTHRWAEMIREAVPLAIGGGLAAAYYSIDQVMLSKLDTFRAVGVYGVAYKFTGIISFLPQAMNLAMLTLLARAWPDDRPAFERALRRAGTTLLLAAVLIAVEFFLFAGDAIRLLYGGRYVVADGATRLVVAGECLAFFTTLGVTVFAAMSRNRLYPIAALIGLVFNVSLNLVLIPEFSFRGAAWVTLGTELIVVTLIWVPLARSSGHTPFGLGVFAKSMLGGLLAAGLGVLALEVLPWEAAAVLVAVAYLLFLQIAQVPQRGGLAALLRRDDAQLLGNEPVGL